VLVRLLNRIQDKARLMGAMMERHGVDPVEASRIRAGTALAAAWRRCLACPKGEQCAAWLEDSSATGSQAPSFCPNASFLAEGCVRTASWPTASPMAIAGQNRVARDGDA
jgi:Family of unknown function (DUF6455)